MLTFFLALSVLSVSFAVPVPKIAHADVNGRNGFADRHMLACRHALVWFNFEELAIPGACMSYMSLAKPDLATLFKSEIHVVNSGPNGRSRILVDKLDNALNAEWLQTAYTRLSAYRDAYMRHGNTFEARLALERKYHPRG